MVSTAQLCIYCKGGKNLCGLGKCPLLDKVKMEKKMQKIPENGFFGPSPSIFVGRFGYPDIFMGPMGDMGSSLGENPEEWFGRSYDEIIEKRSFILRSKLRQSVHSRSRFAEENRLLAMAKKPTDVEMDFKGKPVYRMSFSDMVRPMGPSVSVKGVRIAENVKVKKIVEKVVSDEMKANDSATILYNRNVDIYKLTTILSSGALGLEKNKKMVPTRWSITAMDDIIGKNLMKSVRTFPSVNEYRVYESEFLNNRFVTLFMPGNWEFENFEAWKPGSFWSFSLKKTEIVEEYEPFQGRTRYADKQTGGYYAARIGVLEKLNTMKRQARVVSFREVYEGYVVPVGVWQVRENVRNAMKSGCRKFATLKEALDYIRPRLKIPLEEYRKKSRMLRQKRLEDFF
ncbi:MAG: hypothetical protein JSV92_03900 [archaeon]|nr:MAG: hypothetical protein JSV92_03900 [archaeon]